MSRWALRCVACFFVTKEAGRLFCPRCGNATLERVEVMVSPEGAEFYGVRKSHTLRGTRFPLPKPKVRGARRWRRRHCGACSSLREPCAGAREAGRAGCVAPARVLQRAVCAACLSTRGTRACVQGGHGGNIILCEDQMLKKLRRRKKQADEAADPFAPEFGKDTWHVGGKTQAGLDPSKVGAQGAGRGQGRR